MFNILAYRLNFYMRLDIFVNFFGSYLTHLLRISGKNISVSHFGKKEKNIIYISALSGRKYDTETNEGDEKNEKEIVIV